MHKASLPKPAPKGSFTSCPGQHILDDFKDWLEKTGQPDLWEHHCPTRPPRDLDFEELVPFEIPEKLRPDVGMATCPICSPEAAKYYAGVLAWFPHEGVLRAIGHECARSHFGALLHNLAIAKRKRRQAVGTAQDFLIDTLPLIAPLREEVAGLETAARDIDTLRQAFWSRSSKTACAKLARLGNNRPLVIEEVREITVVNVYGQEQTRREFSVVKSFMVEGLEFLTRQRSVLASARNAALALQQVWTGDREQALQFVAEELRKDEYLFEAEKLTRAAVSEIEKLREAIVEARAFLSPANLLALSEWSEDPRSGAPVIITFDRRTPDRVRVRSPDRKGHDIRIPIHLQ